MNWLPQSSDIKIIEYVWKTLRKKRPHKLQSSVTNVKSKQDLMNNVIDIWTSLSPAYIESLYNQLPERMRAFLEGNGCITKYRKNQVSLFCSSKVIQTLFVLFLLTHYQMTKF